MRSLGSSAREVREVTVGGEHDTFVHVDQCSCSVRPVEPGSPVEIIYLCFLHMPSVPLDKRERLWCRCPGSAVSWADPLRSGSKLMKCLSRRWAPRFFVVWRQGG